MNLEDETLLTAYLDGELDAAGRNRVEAATLASPGLARRLRDLAEARDIVESLSRPAPLFDVSAIVVQRITAPQRPWAFRVRVTRVVSPRWLAIGSGLAAAASLLVSLSLISQHVGPRPTKGRPIDLTGLVGSHKKSAPLLSPTVAAQPSRDGSRTSPASPAGPVVAAAATAPQDLLAEMQFLRDQDQLRKLLDRPLVRKIRLNVDQITAREREKLELAIEQTQRKNAQKGQISIAPGLLIDPSAKRGALVIALLLDEEEQRRLETKLAAEFGSIDVPAAASASEVLQLADIGHVSFSEPYGTVTPPPPDAHGRERLGSKSLPDGPLAIPPGDSGASLPDPLTIRPRRTPFPGAQRNGAVEETAKPTLPPDSRLATVLIWLAPRQASGVGEP